MMKKFLSLVFMVAWCLVPASLLLKAQQRLPDARCLDCDRVGPQVGQRVPDFQLQDQFGKNWTRDSIMGPKGAMLVFFRSADW